jgi:hypothetical protein
MHQEVANRAKVGQKGDDAQQEGAHPVPLECLPELPIAGQEEAIDDEKGPDKPVSDPVDLGQKKGLDQADGQRLAYGNW